MWKKVEDYTLNFHNHPRRYAIHLKLADQKEYILDHLSIDEFSSLGDLLRGEPDVWCHSTRGDIAAHAAPLHEEELD